MICAHLYVADMNMKCGHGAVRNALTESKFTDS